MKQYANELQGVRCGLEGPHRLVERTICLTPDQMSQVSFPAIGHSLKEETLLYNGLLSMFGLDKDGHCVWIFKPMCKYVLSASHEVIAGPLSSKNATIEAGKVPGAYTIGVEALARLLAGFYLNSSDACHHYGPDVSSTFLANIPSAVLSAAVSRFGEALASQLALWERFWAAKRADPQTDVTPPGVMSRMSTTRFRNDKEAGWSLEVRGKCILQIVSAWKLPFQYHIESTRRNGQLVQDVWLDLKKSGSNTRGIVTITVIFGDRNTRKICKL